MKTSPVMVLFSLLLGMMMHLPPADVLTQNLSVSLPQNPAGRLHHTNSTTTTCNGEGGASTAAASCCTLVQGGGSESPRDECGLTAERWSPSGSPNSKTTTTPMGVQSQAELCHQSHVDGDCDIIASVGEQTSDLPDDKDDTGDGSSAENVGTVCGGGSYWGNEIHSLGCTKVCKPGSSHQKQQQGEKPSESHRDNSGHPWSAGHPWSSCSPSSKTTPTPMGVQTQLRHQSRVGGVLFAEAAPYQGGTTTTDESPGAPIPEADHHGNTSTGGAESDNESGEHDDDTTAQEEAEVMITVPESSSSSSSSSALDARISCDDELLHAEIPPGTPRISTSSAPQDVLAAIHLIQGAPTRGRRGRIDAVSPFQDLDRFGLELSQRSTRCQNQGSDCPKTFVHSLKNVVGIPTVNAGTKKLTKHEDHQHSKDTRVEKYLRLAEYLLAMTRHLRNDIAKQPDSCRVMGQYCQSWLVNRMKEVIRVVTNPQASNQDHQSSVFSTIGENLRVEATHTGKEYHRSLCNESSPTGTVDPAELSAMYYRVQLDQIALINAAIDRKLTDPARVSYNQPDVIVTARMIQRVVNMKWTVPFFVEYLNHWSFVMGSAILIGLLELVFYDQQQRNSDLESTTSQALRRGEGRCFTRRGKDDAELGQEELRNNGLFGALMAYEVPRLVRRRYDAMRIPLLVGIGLMMLGSLSQMSDSSVEIIKTSPDDSVYYETLGGLFYLYVGRPMSNFWSNYGMPVAVGAIIYTWQLYPVVLSFVHAIGLNDKMRRFIGLFIDVATEDSRPYDAHASDEITAQMQPLTANPERRGVELGLRDQHNSAVRKTIVLVLLLVALLGCVSRWDLSTVQMLTGRSPRMSDTSSDSLPPARYRQHVNSRSEVTYNPSYAQNLVAIQTQCKKEADEKKRWRFPFRRTPIKPSCTPSCDPKSGSMSSSANVCRFGPTENTAVLRDQVRYEKSIICESVGHQVSDEHLRRAWVWSRKPAPEKWERGKRRFQTALSYIPGVSYLLSGEDTSAAEGGVKLTLVDTVQNNTYLEIMSKEQLPNVADLVTALRVSGGVLDTAIGLMGGVCIRRDAARHCIDKVSKAQVIALLQNQSTPNAMVAHIVEVITVDVSAEDFRRTICCVIVFILIAIFVGIVFGVGPLSFSAGSRTLSEAKAEELLEGYPELLKSLQRHRDATNTLIRRSIGALPLICLLLPTGIEFLLTQTPLGWLLPKILSMFGTNTAPALLTELVVIFLCPSAYTIFFRCLTRREAEAQGLVKELQDSLVRAAMEEGAPSRYKEFQEHKVLIQELDMTTTPLEYLGASEPQARPPINGGRGIQDLIGAIHRPQFMDRLIDALDSPKWMKNVLEYMEILGRLRTATELQQQRITALEKAVTDQSAELKSQRDELQSQRHEMQRQRDELETQDGLLDHMNEKLDNTTKATARLSGRMEEARGASPIMISVGPGAGDGDGDGGVNLVSDQLFSPNSLTVNKNNVSINNHHNNVSIRSINNNVNYSSNGPRSTTPGGAAMNNQQAATAPLSVPYLHPTNLQRVMDPSTPTGSKKNLVTPRPSWQVLLGNAGNGATGSGRKGTPTATSGRSGTRTSVSPLPKEEGIAFAGGEEVAQGK